MGPIRFRLIFDDSGSSAPQWVSTRRGEALETLLAQEIKVLTGVEIDLAGLHAHRTRHAPGYAFNRSYWAEGAFAVASPGAPGAGGATLRALLCRFGESGTLPKSPRATAPPAFARAGGKTAVASESTTPPLPGMTVGTAERSKSDMASPAPPCCVAPASPCGPTCSSSPRCCSGGARCSCPTTSDSEGRAHGPLPTPHSP